MLAFSFTATSGHGLSCVLLDPDPWQGGAWYIPADSNLLFDIEILHRVGNSKPEPNDL